MKWIILFDDCLVHVLHQQMKEMEWNAQGKGIILGHFYFTGHRCVEKLMIGFRIDGRTIKSGKLVCISVI
jgi:hypothetical protein